MLQVLRDEADVVVDTGELNVHQLHDRLVELVGRVDSTAGMQTSVVSFGFKYGIPLDVDLVFDCRFLPNPHWVPELRPLTGLDLPVRDYVLVERGDEGAAEPPRRRSSPACCPPTSARASPTSRSRSVAPVGTTARSCSPRRSPNASASRATSRWCTTGTSSDERAGARRGGPASSRSAAATGSPRRSAQRAGMPAS